MARILMVDDDEPLRERVRQHLGRHGHAVFTAADAQQAFAALLARGFDLILADIQMPHIDGLKMLKCIRAEERTREVPVIVLSALSDTDSVRTAAKLGVAKYLTKPTSGRILILEIERALARAEESRAGALHDGAHPLRGRFDPASRPIP
jgi:DNA-binding response OmpR family regulator